MHFSCLDGRCASVVMLGWESIECILHDKSSRACNIRRATNGFQDEVEQARACRIVLRMLAGSYSGLVRHEPVQR